MKFIVGIVADVMLNIEIKADCLEDAVMAGRDLISSKIIKTRFKSDEITDFEIKSVYSVIEN